MRLIILALTIVGIQTFQMLVIKQSAYKFPDVLMSLSYSCIVFVKCVIYNKIGYLNIIIKVQIVYWHEEGLETRILGFGQLFQALL